MPNKRSKKSLFQTNLNSKKEKMEETCTRKMVKPQGVVFKWSVISRARTGREKQAQDPEEGLEASRSDRRKAPESVWEGRRKKFEEVAGYIGRKVGTPWTSLRLFSGSWELSPQFTTRTLWRSCSHTKESTSTPQLKKALSRLVPADFWDEHNDWSLHWNRSPVERNRNGLWGLSR